VWRRIVNTVIISGLVSPDDGEVATAMEHELSRPSFNAIT
jgi:hypothetical protein